MKNIKMLKSLFLNNVFPFQVVATEKSIPHYAVKSLALTLPPDTTSDYLCYYDIIKVSIP